MFNKLKLQIMGKLNHEDYDFLLTLVIQEGVKWNYRLTEENLEAQGIDFQSPEATRLWVKQAKFLKELTLKLNKLNNESYG